MTLQIPDELAAQAGCSAQEMIFGLAVGLFVEGRITLGQAARALGFSKNALMQTLAERGIAMPYDAEELQGDVATLRHLFPGQASKPV